MRTLYFALIHSHLSYGILAWGHACSSVLWTNVTLQKRAIRTIYKAAYNSHTDPLFNTSQILKITNLYQYQCVLFMFDFINQNLPCSFDGVFQHVHEVQNIRWTRQSDLFYIPIRQFNFASKLPLYTLPSIWNKWANTIPKCITRTQIKK